MDVDCYVLDDPEKTPVISQSGMARALGLSPRGNAFPRFLASQAMADVVGAELRGKLENPLKFQWGTGGAEQPPATGFDAALLAADFYPIRGGFTSGLGFVIIQLHITAHRQGIRRCHILR